MAEIKTQHCTFLLTPLEWEHAGESWIRSELSLLLEAMGQQMRLRPKNSPTLSLHSLRTLLAGARTFLDSLAVDSDDLFAETEPFQFVPTELDFEFALLEGELSPAGEGEVTLRVMIRTGAGNSGLIGSTFTIDAFHLRRFLDGLEQEINRIAHGQPESFLVTAEV